MPTKEPEFLLREDHDLKPYAKLYASERHALYQLMRAGTFIEQDIHTMLHRQTIGPAIEWECSCEVDPEAEDFEEDFEDSAPAAPQRPMCPLYERGRKGDLLVPCRTALQANPAVKDGVLRQAPSLPADLPPERRDALHFFFQKLFATGGYVLEPCRLLHRALQTEFIAELYSPGPLFRVKAGPSVALPAPGGPGEKGLPAMLEKRQTVLDILPEAEAAVEQQRRNLLLLLMETGRLTLRDIDLLIFRVVLSTDEGFVPCRDDPQRNVWESSQDQEDGDDEDGPENVSPVRCLCPLQERAKLGDRAVPCVEALRMAPDPEMIEKERIFREANEAELKEDGETPRARVPLPRSWSGPEDQPGGPKDIVNLLQIRPCHLVGRIAASYLCDLGRHLLAHPAPPEEDDDEE